MFGKYGKKALANRLPVYKLAFKITRKLKNFSAMPTLPAVRKTVNALFISTLLPCFIIFPIVGGFIESTAFINSGEIFQFPKHTSN
jgi:hypothetical protein